MKKTTPAKASTKSEASLVDSYDPVDDYIQRMGSVRREELHAVMKWLDSIFVKWEKTLPETLPFTGFESREQVQKMLAALDEKMQGIKTILGEH